MNSMELKDILVLAIPLVIVQLGLQIGALISLVRRPAENVRWHNKLIWALIIIFGESVGAIVYFVLGKVEEEEDDDSGD